MDACPKSGCEQFCLGREELGVIYNAIKNTPGGYFDADIRANWDSESIGNKNGIGPLHRLKTVGMVALTRQVRDRGICTLMALMEKFGVPEIPERSFSYFVRSTWAYRKIDEVANRGVELSSIEKLKVFQEIFIGLSVHPHY